MEINESDILNEGYYDEEKALACLLNGGVIFLNTVDLSKAFPEWYKEKVYTTVCYVNANDVFAWGCADAESISNSDGDADSEIISLYKLWKENNNWGPIKWLCLKRNQQPQNPIKRDMSKSGYWDEQLESLPENGYDKACKELQKK